MVNVGIFVCGLGGGIEGQKKLGERKRECHPTTTTTIIAIKAEQKHFQMNSTFQVAKLSKWVSQYSMITSGRWHV